MCSLTVFLLPFLVRVPSGGWQMMFMGKVARAPGKMTTHITSFSHIWYVDLSCFYVNFILKYLLDKIINILGNLMIWPHHSLMRFLSIVNTHVPMSHLFHTINSLGLLCWLRTFLRGNKAVGKSRLLFVFWHLLLTAQPLVSDLVSDLGQSDSRDS